MASEHDIAEPQISPELLAELSEVSLDKRVRALRFEAQETLDFLAAIKPKVAGVPGFWAFTLLQHTIVARCALSSSDRHALSFLADVELVQDPKDPRPFELKFHFKENPYFSNETLSKVYSLPEGTDPAPADGSITDEMRSFEDDDLSASAMKIDWKSPDKDLCAKHPRGAQDDDTDEYDGDQGSFFWYFAAEGDPFSLGLVFQQQILPDAIDYFNGEGEMCEGNEDYDDEEDEEDDEEEDEIDLEDEDENPPKKKQRV